MGGLARLTSGLQTRFFSERGKKNSSVFLQLGLFFYFFCADPGEAFKVVGGVFCHMVLQRAGRKHVYVECGDARPLMRYASRWLAAGGSKTRASEWAADTVSLKIWSTEPVEAKPMFLLFCFFFCLFL